MYASSVTSNDAPSLPAPSSAPAGRPAGTVRAAIAGASGYAGGEMLRLLASHPQVEVVTVTAHASAGRPLAEVASHLDLAPGPDGKELVLQETTPEVLAGHDVVVLALPHGQSGLLSAQLRAADPQMLVLDLGADHRLESAADWADYYGGEHAGTWTYGMPELPLADGSRQRDLLRGAREIAVPGCNASAVTFALAPLVAAGLLDASALGVVLPVGYSGAGRSPKQHLLLTEAGGGAVAYGAGGTHRHIPEILQNLRRAGGPADARLTFTPVLVPMSRGILAVATAPVGPGTTSEQLLDALRTAYADEPFLRVLPEGSMPATADTRGANTVHLGAVVDRRSGTATVLAALDNLVKGTAGAAIQSLNLALGLPETAGLPRIALRP